MFAPQGAQGKVAIITVVVFAIAAGVTWAEMPFVSVVLGGLSGFRLVSLIKDKLAQREDTEE